MREGNDTTGEAHVAFPLKASHSPNGTKQTQFKQKVKLLLAQSVKGLRLNLPEWLELRGTSEKREPQSKRNPKSAYTLLKSSVKPLL